jgi:hypothetical protein
VAQEKESDQYGVFTKHVIEGIKSGQADLDSDGRITMGELYRYVHDQVLDEGFQEPMKWDLNVRGDLIISRSGKTPREERRKQIREIIFDLAKKGFLPDDILDKARQVVALEPDRLSEEDRTYDRLLDQLLKKRLEPVEFIRKWDKVRRRQEEVKTEIKPHKPQPVEVEPTEPKPDAKAPIEPRPSPPIPPRPCKASNALIFGAAAGVILLLMTGGWLYYKYQQKKIEGFQEQVKKLERAVAEAKNQEQLKELSKQRKDLSDQVEGISKQATIVGLASLLEDLQNNLKQVQIQEETLFKIYEFNEQVEELAREVAKVDNLEQITPLYRLRDDLSHRVAGFSEQATGVGLESQLEELQNRLKEIQIQLASKEREIIASRTETAPTVARLFVETVPAHARVRILNIEQPFQQGMELEPGSYLVEVAAEGYETAREQISLEAGHEEPFIFELQR